MMAFDSSHTPPSRPDDALLARVRDELRAYQRDGTKPDALRLALLDLARDARTKGILPEHLLVILKDAWNGLSEVRGMHDVAEQVRMQQRVVTMCITAYYSV